MKTKMNLILNEKEFALTCLDYNTYEANNIWRTLEIIAQYYYQYQGFRKVKITSLLIDFLNKSYPPYQKNKRKWDDACAVIARRTGGKPLLEIEGVWLTEKELEIINGINNKIIARLAFTMACIAKMNNARNPKNNGWINLDAKYIFNAAHVCQKSRDLRLNEMKELGLIELPKKVNNCNIRVCFLDESGSDNTYFIADFRELGLLFQREFQENKKIGICSRCGRYYIKSGEFCADCLKIKEKLKPPIIKRVICVDCGKEFFIDARINRKTRCNECQHEYRKLQYRLNKKKNAEFSTVEI